MTDNPVDIICLILWSIAGGMLIGAHWARREWIKACLKRKLVRFNAAMGKLVWREDAAEAP